MRCPDCGCDNPRCADGCTYTWRERFTWWTSRTFWSWLRSNFWPTHQRTHEVELKAWREFLEHQGMPATIPKYPSAEEPMPRGR